MPTHTKPEVINMNPHSTKKKKPWLVCTTVLSSASRESIHGHVRVWVTCNDIIPTRVTPHCHRAFFSRACEIDISFTNIPGIFFSRPGFYGGLRKENQRYEQYHLVAARPQRAHVRPHNGLTSPDLCITLSDGWINVCGSREASLSMKGDLPIVSFTEHFSEKLIQKNVCA